MDEELRIRVKVANLRTVEDLVMKPVTNTLMIKYVVEDLNIHLLVKVIIVYGTVIIMYVSGVENVNRIQNYRLAQ